MIHINRAKLSITCNLSDSLFHFKKKIFLLLKKWINFIDQWTYVVLWIRTLLCSVQAQRKTHQWTTWSKKLNRRPFPIMGKVYFCAVHKKGCEISLQKRSAIHFNYLFTAKSWPPPLHSTQLDQCTCTTCCVGGEKNLFIFLPVACLIAFLSPGSHSCYFAGIWSKERRGKGGFENRI